MVSNNALLLAIMLVVPLVYAFAPSLLAYSTLRPRYDCPICSNTIRILSKRKFVSPKFLLVRVPGVKLFSAIDVTPPEDEDKDEEEANDSYSAIAESEFAADVTSVDWGGALGKLRERINDLKKGKSSVPSNALFRVMTRESPNEVIINFLQEAKPDVISAMTGAVMSLLGGLSNPAIGVETIVKADGEKLGNLCFQVSFVHSSHQPFLLTK